MLPLVNQWVGALYLATLLTSLAYFVDQMFRVSGQWKGVGFIIPVSLLSWMVSRGYDIFMRSEPSLILLYNEKLLSESLKRPYVKNFLVSCGYNDNENGDKTIQTEDNASKSNKATIGTISVKSKKSHPLGMKNRSNNAFKIIDFPYPNILVVSFMFFISMNFLTF